MTKKSGIIWNYYNPSYQKELLTRPHWKTVDTLFGGIMPKTDISTLLRNGCIAGYHFNKGRIKFSVCLEGILASGYCELLVESVKQCYTDTRGLCFPPIKEAIRPYILYGDKEKSLQKSQIILNSNDEIPDWLIIFFAVTLGKKKLALDCLKKKEKSGNSRRLYDLGKCRKLIFQNNRKACTFLKDSISLAQSVYERIKIATAWKHLFENDDEARLILADAKPLINNEQDLIDYTEAWKKLFNDDKEAMFLIHEHEKYAKTTAEFYTCAILWMYLFGERLAAKKCIENMEKLTKSETNNIKDVYNNNTNNAWLWISLLGNKNKAREWLIEVEKVIIEMEPYDRVSAWSRLSQFYKSELNDDVEHRRCYKIYEEESDDFWD